MRRVFTFCFACFLLAALALFCLFSCGERRSLYELLLPLSTDESLPAGKILVYGGDVADAVDENFVCDYLFLPRGDAFAGKIDEMAVYSSLKEPFCELCLLRVCRADDLADARRLLSQRAEAVARTLRTGGIDGFAARAEVYVRGNTAALLMMPDNAAAKKLVFGG